MGNPVRYAALSALGTAIVAAVPALGGRVVLVHAEAEDDARFPSVALVPSGPFPFTSEVEDEYGTDATIITGATSAQLLRVGMHTGTVQLQVFGQAAVEREEYGERLLAMFYSAQGSLTLDATGLRVNGQDLVPAFAVPVTFDLTSDEWKDEMVFAKERFSFVELELTYPAMLLLQSGVYTITQLVHQYTADLAATTPAIDEAFTVASDGTLTPYP